MKCLGGSCLLNNWRLGHPIPLKTNGKSHQIPRGGASNAVRSQAGAWERVNEYGDKNRELALVGLLTRHK